MNRFKEIFKDFKAEIFLAGAIFLFCGIIFLSAKGISYLTSDSGEPIDVVQEDKLDLQKQTATVSVPDAKEKKDSKPDETKLTDIKHDDTKEVVQTPSEDKTNLENDNIDEDEELVEESEKNKETTIISDVGLERKSDITSTESDILLTEEMSGTLINNKLELKKGLGAITVSNRGIKDRIWDIDIFLEENKETNLDSDQLHLSELKHGQQQTFPYRFTTDEAPVLITEKLDCSSEYSGRQKSFVYNKEVPFKLEIQITNTREFNINAKFSKPMPEEAVSVQVSADEGEATYEPHKQLIVWDGNLDKGESVILTVTGKIKMLSTEPIDLSSGAIVVEGDGTFTNMYVSKSEAISSNRFGIEKKQDPDRMDKWLITVFFKNLSEFDCNLNQVNIYQDDTESNLMIRTFKPNELLKTGDVWTENLEIYSDTIPSFGHTVSFSMLPHSAGYSKGSFTYENEKTEVGRLQLVKTFDRKNLRIGYKEVVKASLEVENIGSADINYLEITDEIPDNFEIKKISIMYQGKEKTAEMLTAGGQVDIEDDYVEFKLEDIEDIVGTQFAPEEKILITYELITEKATQGVYQPKAEGFGNTKPEGEHIEIESATEMPVLKTTRGLLGLFLSKDILSTENDDEIKIILYMKNNGRADMKNIVLRDFIPKEFELSVLTGDYKVFSSDSDGTIIEWQAPLLSVGQEHEMAYILTGSGEYSARDIVAMVKS